MGNDIYVTVNRAGLPEQVPIEDLTEDELRDLLKRATPTQVRAYCSLLVHWAQEHINREKAAPLVLELAKDLRKKNKRN